MELFSGIVLTCVLLGIAGFLLREVFGDKAGASLKKYTGTASPVVQNLLIGKIGRVVQGRDNTGVLKIRIQGERWSANLIGGHELPVGTEVRVTGVNGMVLDIEECVDEDASPPEAAVEEVTD